MRTWVLLSCLAICLLVVSARQRRSAVSTKVTRELLEKLLQVKREEIKKSSNTATSLRERIGRVLQNVHQLQKKNSRRELQDKEYQKDEAMSRLLNLLKKKLTVRKPDPNEIPKKPDGEVLGKATKQKVPQVKDAIEKRPHKNRESSETVEFEDPIFGLEGGDVIEMDDTSELIEYVALEMLASKKFCAKPVDEDIVDELGADLESVANDIITAIENTISALQAADGDTTAVVDAVAEELFGGFEEFGEKLEETVRDTMVMLYRYILYGTESNTHCEIGDWFYSWEFDDVFPVNDSYYRLWCLENGLYFFNFFLTDPFNPLWSDVDDEDIAAFEARRCNNASNLFWETFPEDVELEAMVDTVIMDLECVANKLEDAMDDEEVVERNLKRRDLNETEDFDEEAVDPVEDKIANSIEGLAAVVTEILVDITELMFTLIMAQPVDHTEQFEDRSMLTTIYKMAKRHHK